MLREKRKTYAETAAKALRVDLRCRGEREGEYKKAKRSRKKRGPLTGRKKKDAANAPKAYNCAFEL